MAAKPALKPVPSAAEEAPPAKKKSRLVPILAVALVLSFGAGGAAWHFLGPKSAKSSPAQAAKAVVKQPTFMTLEPFTVNLQGGEHFLQIGVVLQLDSDKTAEEVKTYLPKIRNDILLLLSSQSPADLDAPNGKRKLADAILAQTKKPLDEETQAQVQDVLFGSLVVQ